MNRTTLPNSREGRIVWVGSYPAHYVRAFHCKIESDFPGKLAFVYITSRQSEFQRSAEQGDLPSDPAVVPSKSILGIPKLMSRLNPRALMVAGHFPRSLVVAALWGFARRCPALYWSDTNLMDIRKRGFLMAVVRRFVLRPFLRKMHWLLYIGTRNRDFYHWVCGRDLATHKLRFLPYPHDSALFERCSARKRSATGVCEFLYLGRLASEKCVTHLVELFAGLSTAARAKARLTIAGDGTERQRLERLIQRRDLAGDVRFLGPVPPSQVPEIMSQADVFVLPSNHEPWGLVVNEVLSSAVPVIVPSWVGAASDLVVTGQTGIQTKDNSPEALKEAMLQLIDRADLRHRLGQNGQKLVRAGGFDISSAERAFAKILDALDMAESC
ncbi:MAG: glycosyltransferase [Gammaproteobacteria bacterium]|nr:glycosyltransferase [Gammaproteobacteria bacterium]